MSHSTRRDLLRAGLVAGAGTLLANGRRAAAVEPIERPAAPAAPLKLALAAYSFRQLLDVKKTPRRWTFADFIEKAASWGTEGVELTEYYFEKPIVPGQIAQLKRHCHLAGQTIMGTPIGNTFTNPPGEARERQIRIVQDWINVSADLGSPCIRVFAGNAPRGMSEKDARRNVIECLEIVGDIASRRGIFLALENHGGVVATPEGVLEIIQAVKCPWIGVNLDTGNFRSDDPYADLAKIAPYAVTVQYKVEVVVAGKKQPSDPARVAKILRDANYRGWVALEHEAAEDPLTTVPGHLETLRKALA
jgi:sugar phosphate isomerase/epimerase